MVFRIVLLCLILLIIELYTFQVLKTLIKTGSEFKIEIINTGQLGDANKSDSCFGIANTTNRLELLFGKKALFSLKNLDTKNVISEITIKI